MMLNPYSQKSLLEFLQVFFMRFGQLLTGKIALNSLASDEYQIIALSLIALSAAIVGSLILFKKMMMLANSLSHTILFGIVTTFFIFKSSLNTINDLSSFKMITLAALISGFSTIFFTTLISKFSFLRKDASMALVFSFLSALGIILISLVSRNSHLSVELIIGNVDALHYKDLKSLFINLSFVLGLTLIFFRALKISTFDPIFAKLIRFGPTYCHYLIILLLSMTALSSFRAVGVVLVLAFFLIPPLIAKDYAKSLEKQILYAALIGVFSAIMSVAISRHLLSYYKLPLSTGGLSVCFLYFLFIVNQLAQKAYLKLYSKFSNQARDLSTPPLGEVKNDLF